jgi:hypothetical protein
MRFGRSTHESTRSSASAVFASYSGGNLITPLLMSPVLCEPMVDSVGALSVADGADQRRSLSA